MPPSPSKLDGVAARQERGAEFILHAILFCTGAGAPPQRELTLTPSLGSPCPRSGVAAGASALALGPHPSARTDADTFARISMSSLRCGRRRFCTGAGAPPPARTDADTFARISMSSLRCGRRRFCTGAGAPPQRELTLTPSLGFPCPRSVWPQALLHWRWGPTPARTDADTSLGFPCPRSAWPQALLHWRWAPPRARTDADTFARISMSSLRCGRPGASALAAGPHPARELTLTPSLGFPCPRSGVAAGAPLAVGPSASARSINVSEPLRRTRMTSACRG